MQTINSKENPKIKEVLSLRKASERKKAGLILIEGAREIGLALNSGIKIDRFFYSPDYAGGKEEAFFDAIEQKVIFEVPSAIFKKISARENPDGLLAVAQAPHRAPDSLKLSSNPLVIVLEAVEKPGNLGAILRTADAAGADAVLIADPHTDIFNPNVIRASQGTVFTVPVAACSSREAIDFIKNNKIRIFSASLTPDALEYTAADYRGPSAIVFGTEADGLSDAWLKAGQAVAITMKGKIDSLNISVSAGIMVYEAVRQRSKD